TDYNGAWITGYVAAIIVAGLVQIPLFLWTGTPRARHFVYILSLAFVFWLYAHDGSTVSAFAVAAAGAVLFLAVGLPASPLSARASASSGAPAFYSLVLALMGIVFLHAEFDGETGATAAIAVGCIALSILALALAGRDNGAVRYLAYCAFAVEVLY